MTTTPQPLLTIEQASAAYPVFVARGLVDRVGSLVVARGRVFVATSPALWEKFGERVARSFAPRAELVAVEEGEANKTFETANAVVTRLLELGARRDAMLVVVGGGMIGDTAGFAASIFLRGIDLVQVPTTLLAQVDSSIGGKVGVNHPMGKNLIGSFYPPRAVVTDTAVLDELPRRELLSGIFEALKGGVIRDPQLFDVFETRRDAVLARDPETIDSVVQRKIRVKADIVSADEREADLRRLLNYGHTVAHGIETALRYEGLTHGEAVAWGMVAANALAMRRGLLARDEAARIEQVIRSYEPAALPPLDREEVFAATAHDKKNTGSARVMVLPRRVGTCDVVADVTDEEIRFAIDSVL